MEYRSKEYSVHMHEAVQHLREYGNHSLSPWWFDKVDEKTLEKEISENLGENVTIRKAVFKNTTTDYGIERKDDEDVFWIAETERGKKLCEKSKHLFA